MAQVETQADLEKKKAELIAQISKMSSLDQLKNVIPEKKTDASKPEAKAESKSAVVEKKEEVE